MLSSDRLFKWHFERKWKTIFLAFAIYTTGLFYIYPFYKEVTTVYPAPDNGAWFGVVGYADGEAVDKNKMLQRGDIVNSYIY